VLRHKWSLHRRRNRATDYAQANVKVGGVWKRVLLHRYILNAPPGQQVDHEDGDGLNCTRENMRLATHAQNQHNAGSHRDSRTSRYRGVSFHKKTGKWRVQLMVNRRRIPFPLFVSEEEAARAYDRAALEHFGEFARLNFSEAT
jgi:hypothetical protein